MIIAGPCLYVDDSMEKSILDTAKELSSFANYFRCKIWGGGPSPDRYNYGISDAGLKTLSDIQRIIPVATECHTPEQIKLCENAGLSAIWIGARNCQNYTLLKHAAKFHGDVWVKRGPGITIAEAAGIYDIMKRDGKYIRIIERGIVTFDRTFPDRWTPDIKGVLWMKYERPEIFETMIIDCSHSIFDKRKVFDIYKAFNAVGVKNFMVECMNNVDDARTDKELMVSTDELKCGLK